MHGMSLAIRILDDAIRQNEQDHEDLIRARQTLLKKRQKPGSNNNLDDGPADLKGLRLPDAIKLVLNQNGPLAFTALKDLLVKRGARLGVPDKPQRFAANLKTAVINSHTRFKYNAQTKIVSLVHEDEDGKEKQ